MMEVIPINTNDNSTSKADLWADRFHAFQESGLSRKEWCQQNGNTGSAATGTATPNIIAALNTNDKNFFVFIRLPPLK